MKKDRIILHCDLNSFFASVEELYHPENRGRPVAVGGDASRRHGIILAKNQLAKKAGVQTAEAIWQAKNKCPGLIIYPPNYDRYVLFSERVRAIMREYTDRVEPFGIDEAWLDVTESTHFGTGVQIADQLRARIRSELGITASVGVSFNKIFAKLGSDLRKPDYTTVISEDNFREVVWPLPVQDLLFVGKRCQSVLNEQGIYTIGQMAACDVHFLCQLVGKYGRELWEHANGIDDSEVHEYGWSLPPKSIGNSVTLNRDLLNYEDMDTVMWGLAEKVASRLRKAGMKARTLTVYIRDCDLDCFSRQLKLNGTNTASVLMKNASYLYHNRYDFTKTIRSMGLRASDLVPDSFSQTSLFEDEEQLEREHKLDVLMDSIRAKYGQSSVKRTLMVLNNGLSYSNDDEKFRKSNEFVYGDYEL